jgi:biopolymer transport protein ExbD
MRFKRKPVKRGRIELIAMIDSMLILLIFYMSFSTFAEMEREFGVKLPTAEEATKWKKAPEQLVLNIRGTGEMIVNQQQTDLLTLEKMLNAYVKVNPKLSLVLRADKKLYYKEISRVLEVCARSSLFNITFVALESE